MRVCQQCGQTTNDDSLAFCQYCGTQLTDNNYQQPSYGQQAYNQPYQQNYGYQYQQPQYPQQYQQNYAQQYQYGQQNYAQPARYGQQAYNQPYQQQYMGNPAQNYGAYMMASQGMETGKSKGVGISIIGLIMAIMGFVAMLLFEEYGSGSNVTLALLADELDELYNQCLVTIIIAYALTVIGLILSMVGIVKCRRKAKAIGIVGLVCAVISLIVCIIDTVSFVDWIDVHKEYLTMFFVR